MIRGGAAGYTVHPPIPPEGKVSFLLWKSCFMGLVVPFSCDQSPFLPWAVVTCFFRVSDLGLPKKTPPKTKPNMVDLDLPFCFSDQREPPFLKMLQPCWPIFFF